VVLAIALLVRYLMRWKPLQQWNYQEPWQQQSAEAQQRSLNRLTEQQQEVE
jgi:hypothetical protein